MIDPKELRLGSLIYSELRGELSIIVVDYLSRYGVNEIINDFEAVFHNPMCDEGQIKPIPLTEEWLLRFGADQNISDPSRYRLKGIEIYKFSHGFVFNPSSSDMSVLIKHVHQLQNLYYYTLEGEELSCNV